MVSIIHTKYFFFKFPNQHKIENNPPVRSEDIGAEAHVDIKKFLGFLHSNLIRPANVIMCLSDQRKLVLHVLLNDLYLTYIISVLST